MTDEDLIAHFHEQAVEAYVDFRDRQRNSIAGRSRDRRLGVAASQALFHFREHFPEKWLLSRSEVERRCAAYGVLGDVANASKHGEISASTPHGAPLVSTFGEIQEEIWVVQYEDGQGRYHHVHKIVTVTLADGTQRNLLDVLTDVLNFWESYLHSLGLLAAARTFQSGTEIASRSREETEAARLDLEMVQGHRFQQKVRLFRFDESKGRAEPLPLPQGSKVQMSIRPRPQLDLQLSIVHDESGAEFIETITLSPEESERVESFESDDERQAFISSLPAAQEAMRELAGKVKAHQASISSKG